MAIPWRTTSTDAWSAPCHPSGITSAGLPSAGVSPSQAMRRSASRRIRASPQAWQAVRRAPSVGHQRLRPAGMLRSAWRGFGGWLRLGLGLDRGGAAPAPGHLTFGARPRGTSRPKPLQPSHGRFVAARTHIPPRTVAVGRLEPSLSGPSMIRLHPHNVRPAPARHAADSSSSEWISRLPCRRAKSEGQSEETVEVGRGRWLTRSQP
jgi:hypothetical protein